MALRDALPQQGTWHILRPFFFFWLGLRLIRKASKGTGLNRSKLHLDIASMAGCCVSVGSQIVITILLLRVSLHVANKAQSCWDAFL